MKPVAEMPARGLPAAIRSSVRALLSRVGVHAYTARSLPTGIDWIHDLRRSGAIGPSPLCFDVGANVGQTVGHLRAHLPAATIHAFEPFEAPLAALRDRFGGDAGVHIERLALGSIPQRLQVVPHVDSQQSSLHGAAVQAPGAAAQSIEVETVDRFCEQRGIDRVDILKSDTEGFDLEVLRGATRLLRARRIGFVYVEVGFSDRDAQHTPYSAVLEHLQQFGFRPLGLYETYPLHHYPEPHNFCNALFGLCGRPDESLRR